MSAIRQYLATLGLATGCLGATSTTNQVAAPAHPPAAAAREFGPAWHDFNLVLEPGGRGTEGLGPVFGREQGEDSVLWRVSPFVAHFADPVTERIEYEILYPLATYDRFGTEYRWQFFQLFNFAGSTTVDDASKKRTTIFPVYFRQTSSEPTNNYVAVLPFYGHLKNRLFRDDVRFVALPLYVQTTKRAVVTDNFLIPFFHLRHGGGVSGWQFWPVVGAERKAVTWRTNVVDELEAVPGHEKMFAAFPFFFREHVGLGTPNPVTNLFIFPFYLRTRSPEMDYTSVFFFGHRTNRADRFEEWSAPWPFIGWARGPGKTAHRLWPLYGKAENEGMQSDFALWPFYTHKRWHGPSFERERTRLIYFGYSDLRLANPATGDTFRRRDLWPLFTWRHELDGRERLQMLAPVEPVLPNNKSIERLYSPVWSLWRSESNAKTHAASQSLLWNLWRRDVTPGHRRTSFLFGCVKTEKTDAGRSWRLFWTPFRRPAAAAAPAPDVPPAPRKP